MTVWWGVGHGQNPRGAPGDEEGGRNEEEDCSLWDAKDWTSPLTDEHLGHLQTLPSVWRKQSLPSSYLINFTEYVSSIGV